MPKLFTEYLREADENPANIVMSVAELVRKDADSEDEVAKTSIPHFLMMLKNAGLPISYAGLKAYYNAHPELSNVIQTFNDKEIIFVGQGDEEDSESLGKPQGDIPPAEVVDKMAKRAMKARASEDLDEAEDPGRIGPDSGSEYKVVQYTRGGQGHTQVTFRAMNMSHAETLYQQHYARPETALTNSGGMVIKITEDSGNMMDSYTVSYQTKSGKTSSIKVNARDKEEAKMKAKRKLAGKFSAINSAQLTEGEAKVTIRKEDGEYAVYVDGKMHSSYARKIVATNVANKLKKGEMKEGWYNTRPIDKERYTDLSAEGLEGPFMTRSGKVLYYDPKEGKYYDRDSDMYLDYEEWKAYDAPSEEVKENTASIDWPDPEMEQHAINAIRHGFHAYDAFDHIYSLHGDHAEWLNDNETDIMNMFGGYGLEMESVQESAHLYPKELISDIRQEYQGIAPDLLAATGGEVDVHYVADFMVSMGNIDFKKHGIVDSNHIIGVVTAALQGYEGIVSEDNEYGFQRWEDEEDESKEPARQYKGDGTDEMVEKDGKVIVIDKEDLDRYLEDGWQLAESIEEGSRGRARQACRRKGGVINSLGQCVMPKVEIEEKFDYWQSPSSLAKLAGIRERSLTKAEKKKMKHYEKKLSKSDFIDRYGKKEGESIYYATATKMAKDNA